MAFRIGQKVVCVNDQPEPGTGWELGAELRVGAIYTIEAVGLTRVGNPGVLVAEARRYAGFNYLSSRFRPLTEKKTDISCFTELLDRENKNCRVPVSDHQSN